MDNYYNDIMQTLPHSIEAEQAIIGSILIDPRCLQDILGKASPVDFYLQANRDIYETAVAMFGSGEAIDPVTILDRMVREGAEEKQLRTYMLQLMDTTPTASNVEEYIKILSEKSTMRRIAEVAGELTAMAADASSTSREMLEAAERGIYGISRGDDNGGLRHVSEAVISAYDGLAERAEADKPVPGVQTGLPDLDKAIAGLGDSDLVILAARPAMGKTSLGLGVALDAGKFSGKDVAVFSLEMSMEQLALRLISQECYIEADKLITGHLTEDDWTKVALAAESLAASKIYIDDDPSVTVATIKSRCRRLSNLGLVVIDYLQLMQSAGGKPTRGENRQQIVSDISRSLKIMAKELNVPVLCLSQLSRANESRQDKRPMLSDLRESGAIEQDADVVMFLYRDSYYNPESEEDGIAECIVAKNRHGATGTVELSWLPEFATFASLERRYA